MSDTLRARAERIYDENGLGTAIHQHRRGLRDGSRTVEDIDDLFRAACQEEFARELRNVHKPTADDHAARARSLFIAYYAAGDQ